MRYERDAGTRYKILPTHPYASPLTVYCLPITALMWFIYIVRCADGSLYTGICKDVARRVEEHNSSRLLAASYTRSRRPVTLVYSEAADTRSAAARREYEIKRMTRQDKDQLVKAGRA